MMRDVGNWLNALGLGEHAEAFAKNGVDFDLLSDLTNEDLKDLGVSRLADRKRLLKAIADVSRETATPMAPTHGAERRQLTVMFCDLVGSTDLSGSLDPEELRDVLHAYQLACAGVVDRYDGHVAKYIGDGLLVYFGIPRTHEDDAQRAVSAGLGIVEAMAQLRMKIGIDLNVRIGIHTGLVVAGEMGTGAAREEMAIVGETPNVAARLQALAAPNSIVVSSSTKRLIGDLFLYEDIGIHQLRGIALPAQAWRVVGESSIESRFAAMHAAGPLRLVGREAEIDLLLRRWEQVRQREGQVVLLSGEPGIGKSRVIEALRERIGGAAHSQVRCQCSAYFTNSSLYPFARQIEQAAKLVSSDPPATKLAKLEQLLAGSGQAAPGAMPLLAALLSIPADTGDPVLGLTPQGLKERTLAILVDRLLGLAAHQPLLLIIEDAHWIDPSSEELISALMDRLDHARILMVITYRPDYRPPWSDRADLTALTLNRLSRTHAAALLAEVTGAATLPDTVANQIVAKADGVPLFIEELTKAVLESHLGIDRRGAGSHGGTPQTAIPATLHDTLMARLDRSAATKEVAQVAAVLGRDFSEALLVDVSPVQGDALAGALDELVDAGLLFRRGSPPQTSYLFKHALVQDAAYETMLLRNRRELHARTAESLQARFPEIAEAQPELLAHHYDGAGMPDRAIAYWQRAAAKASKGSNYVEAERQLVRAAALVGQLPDDKRKHTELDLQMAMGAVCRVTRGSGSPQAEEIYGRARALCQELGDDERLLEVVYGQFSSAFNRPRLHDAARYAKEFMQIAERDGNRAAMLVAHQLIGLAAFLLGDFARSRQHLEDSLRSEGIDPALPNLYSQGQYPSGALTYLALGMFALGYPEQARAWIEEALETSESHSKLLYAITLCNGCYLHHIRGDVAAVEANLAALFNLTEDLGIVVFYETARIFQGWTRACQGELDEGIVLMRDALARLSATETKSEHPYMISIVAETHLRAGRWHEAKEQLGEALELAQATDERWYLAELHRLNGEVALAQGDAPTAEAQFDCALTIAGEQSARMWALRAAVGLAGAWCRTGRVAEAHALLGPIVDSFTEGRDSDELIAAKNLLERHRAPGC